MSSMTERKSETENSPLVIVPVLSKAKILTLASVSRYSAPLTKSPVVAAFDSAQYVATGVDSISAHGHELTKTTKAK